MSNANEKNARDPSLYDALEALCVIAKDVFEALGGGEAFIKKERESFMREGCVDARNVGPSPKARPFVACRNKLSFISPIG